MTQILGLNLLLWYVDGKIMVKYVIEVTLHNQKLTIDKVIKHSKKPFVSHSLQSCKIMKKGEEKNEKIHVKLLDTPSVLDSTHL